MFANKEQVIHFMLQGHLHLSKKDYTFFYNLQNIIRNSNQITSNQNKLLDKLLLKYQRQLKKLGHDHVVLSELPYKAKIVDSLDEYLEARIYIDDNNDICLKSPFNYKFLQDFRKVLLNEFEWIKSDKLHKAPYSTYNLKLVYDKVNTHYDKINLCPKIVDLLSKIKEFESVKYWHPTLVKRQDDFYILAANEYLLDAIGDMVLSDDLDTLFMLSQYGVTIDNSVTDNDIAKKFASDYQTSIDLEQIDKLIDWLKLLNVDHVFTARAMIYNQSVTNEIKVKLLANGITCAPVNSTDHKSGVLLKTTGMSVIVDTSNVTKMIHLTNSRRIDVR